MRADVLELQPRIESDPSMEVYAHSLSTLKKIGALAVEPVVDVEYKEAVELLGFEDFETAVAEMLKTDKKLGNELEVENERLHPVIDGQVRARDGESIVDKLENGARSSAALAEQDERYKAQAERDECDVPMAKRANELKPGETLWGVSFAAQQALEKYPEIYDKKFGYDKFLVYIQKYSMGHNNMLSAGSYSIEIRDKAEFIKLLAENNMHIPDDESDGTWLNHARVIEANANEGKDFVLGLRDEYYERIHKKADQHSVSEYIEKNQKTLMAFFKAYYLDLGHAAYTGENNQTMQNFANSVLQNNEKLKPEIRRQLIKINNSQFFDDEDGALMDSVIRYAVAEEMRKGLVDKPAARADKKVDTPVYQPATHKSLVTTADINALLAQNINSGIKAGRSYGGCPGNIELGENDPLAALSKGINIDTSTRVQQQAFGDIESKMDWQWKEGVCIIKDCKTRPGKTKVGPCSICESCTERDNNGEKLEMAGDEPETEKPDNVVPLFGNKKEQKHESSEPIAA